MKLLLFAYFVIGLQVFAIAQTKTISQEEQVWIGFYNQTRLTKKWGIGTDLHLRTREHFFSGLSQSLARVGVSYYLAETARLTAGYAYSNTYFLDSIKNIPLPEHRIWQQFQWQTKCGHYNITQRLRLEERFRSNIIGGNTKIVSQDFNWRIRYIFLVERPLNKNNESNLIALIMSDEINVNFGKQILYNYFDQNRFFLGLKCKINSNDNLQVGYMNIFQQLPAGNKYRNNHVIRIFYFQNLDLRKKSSK